MMPDLILAIALAVVVELIATGIVHVFKALNKPSPTLPDTMSALKDLFEQTWGDMCQEIGELDNSDAPRVRIFIEVVNYTGRLCWDASLIAIQILFPPKKRNIAGRERHKLPPRGDDRRR